MEMTEELFLGEIYNLLLNKDVIGEERQLYIDARNAIEVEKEYYEPIMAGLCKNLAFLSQTSKISKEGGEFMTKLARISSLFDLFKINLFSK